MASANTSTSWSVFTAAAHRVAFFFGALQLLASIGWWLASLAATYFALPFPVAVIAPGAAHAFIMLYAVFPFFMFGFLLTVYPRWLDTAPIARSAYLPPLLLFAGGAALFYPGMYVHRALLLLALLFMLAGWGGVLLQLFRVYRRTQKAQREHTRALNAALSFGWLGIALFAGAVLTDNLFLYRASRAVGLWLFIIPVVFAVSHRMIPFFSSSVLTHYRMVRPPWSLPALIALAGVHALLELAQQPRWLFLPDLAMLTLVLYHTIAWGFFRSFRIRLLAMLHIAFLWLSIGFGLYALQSLVLLLTGSFILGRAPLHALGIGFITGLTIAMATRVTLGHSGQPLMADNRTWLVFLGLNIVAVLRVLADLPLGGRAWLAFVLLSAAAWILCLLPWARRYLPIYLRPRADGKPG